MKKISLHIQILISILLGFLFALIHTQQEWDVSIAALYIKPIGTLFLNSLQAASIPLIITSMIVGISSLEDTTKLSRISGKTFFLYGITTVLSVAFGLLVSIVVAPGNRLSQELRSKLLVKYQSKVVVDQAQELHLMDILANLVPDNIFKAIADNRQILQVVVIAIVFSIALLRIPIKRRKVVIDFCESMNDAFLKIIKMIMGLAPLGTFALISSLLIELGEGNMMNIWRYLYGMIWYVSTVFLCLSFMTLFVYPLIISLFTKVSWREFSQGIRQAQLVALSTSSSSASLPATIESVENNLKVPEDISSFVLPIGATVNMNGTALYQGIAVLFIAQTFGVTLTANQLFIVVLYVTFSAVGAAGIPGASIASLAMLLRILDLPLAGIALITPPDRILDMCRTTTNITGDAAVAVLVASSEGWLDKKEGEEEEVPAL